jgi:hypothetical protein
MALDLSFLAIVLIVLAVSSLLLTFYTWKVCYCGRSDNVAIVLFAFVGHNAFFFMLVPAILRLLFGWESDLAIHVDPMEIVEVYAIEFVSIAVWTISLRLVTRRPPLGQSLAEAVVPTAEKMLAVPRVFLGILLGCSVLIGMDSYLNASAIDLSNPESDMSALVTNRIFWPVGAICGATGGSASALYVLGRGRRQSGTILWVLAIASIAFYIVTFGISGTRNTAIWPLLWLMLVLAIYRTRLLRVAAPPSIIVIVAILAFPDNYASLRRAKFADSISSRIDLFQRGDPRNSSSPMGDIEFRLGCASRYSVAFVRMWDSGRGAHWNPIVNSLYAPLPRRFFPDKPWPTSRDGDQYSAGMYLILTELSEFENYSMTEFLSGPHAYWEFGWIGVIVLSAMTAAYSKLVLAIGRRIACAGPPIVVCLFKPWGYNNPRLWVSDAIVEVTQVLPAVLLLWTLARACTAIWGRVTSTIQNRAIQ